MLSLSVICAGPVVFGFGSPSAVSAGAASASAVSASAVSAGAEPGDLVQVLPPLEVPTQPADSARVSKAVSAGLGSPDLGEPAAAVADAMTGSLLVKRSASELHTPASTVKILTAIAVLRAFGTEERIKTNVVQSEPGRITLVGGGDPTLLSDSPTSGQRRGGLRSGVDLRAATLADLAERTAAKLKAAGASTVSLTYDASIFSGPELAESWPATFPESGIIAPIQGLMANRGTSSVAAMQNPLSPRTREPAAAAAADFAEALETRGITVSGKPRPGRAAAGAESVASVSSPPMSDIVEQMLADSDNDVAEALGRLVAVDAGKPGTQAAGSAAVAAAAIAEGVPADGVRLVDTSGLSRLNSLQPAGLTTLLARAASAEPGDVIRGINPGLAVAGLTGTLEKRFSGISERGSGLVHAKTGTLTGVNTLAGFAAGRDGHLYAFAYLADTSTPGTGSRSALDEAASALVTCDCALP